MIAHAVNPRDDAYLVVPLRDQPTQNIVVLAHLSWLGHRLRPELRTPGLSDRETLLAELRRREFEVAA